MKHSVSLFKIMTIILFSILFSSGHIRPYYSSSLLLFKRGGRWDPSGIKITISGNPGHDAKRYQEREVEKALREVKNETW